ncbi:MAG: hypothetical protein [Bacteriophage sp.]|nr:MAG: hypothetical protein [Bacteriophage sp.]
MEVKSGEGTVVVADCNRYSDECCNNRGWGSGWGAVGGALVGGGFGAAAVSVWDKINDTKADIQKVESTVQAERNHCEVMKGQQEIKCLIENTAKDQEIARLNRVVDAQRDQNIINSVVQALGNKTA